MPTPRKEQLVAELTELLQQAEIAIATSVTSVPVDEQIALRRRLLAEGAHLRVVKNTLLRLAATNAKAEVFAELADGPTALVVGFDEPVGAARGLAKYIADTPGTPMEIRNAVVNGELVDAAYVKDLATVPPRDELLARIAGGLVAKVRELMMLLDATTRDFVGLVEARAAQLEEHGESAAPEASADATPEAEETTEEPAADDTTGETAAEDTPEEPAAEESSDEAAAADETSDAPAEETDEPSEAPAEEVPAEQATDEESTETEAPAETESDDEAKADDAG